MPHLYTQGAIHRIAVRIGDALNHEHNSGRIPGINTDMIRGAIIAASIYEGLSPDEMRELGGEAVEGCDREGWVMAFPEIIGTLAGANVLLDREAQALIIAAERPIRFHIDHPYIQGTKLERDAWAALTRAPDPREDDPPCMYDRGIVAADNSCLRCKAKDGEDCRDI